MPILLSSLGTLDEVSPPSPLLEAMSAHYVFLLFTMHGRSYGWAHLEKKLDFLSVGSSVAELADQRFEDAVQRFNTALGRIQLMCQT